MGKRFFRMVWYETLRLAANFGGTTVLTLPLTDEQHRPNGGGESSRRSMSSDPATCAKSDLERQASGAL
jgi:hypothetical protein